MEDSCNRIDNALEIIDDCEDVMQNRLISFQSIEGVVCTHILRGQSADVAIKFRYLGRINLWKMCLFQRLVDLRF